MSVTKRITQLTAFEQKKKINQLGNNSWNRRGSLILPSEKFKRRRALLLYWRKYFVIMDNAAVEDYINGVNAETSDTSFLCSGTFSDHLYWKHWVQCSKYICTHTCRHKTLFTVLLASFIFQIKADVTLLMKHSFELGTNRQFGLGLE